MTNLELEDLFTPEELELFERFERWQRGEFKFDSEDDPKGNSNDRKREPLKPATEN